MNLSLMAQDLDKLIQEVGAPYDLVETLRTLVKFESNDGLYPINLKDPSCGVTHININTYIKRHKLKNTNFNRNKACSDLIASPKWALLNAIEELEFWKKIHRGNYKLMIKSYNAGWNYNSPKAEQYWNKFREIYYEVNK